MLQLQLPDPLHDELNAWAQRSNISLEQLATEALTEKLSALQQLEYFRARAQRSSREKFRAAMQKVPNVPPIPPDEPWPPNS